MEPTYWHKQAADKPLFPDLLWSRPENKLHAGKLLIIGGNLHGFAAPAEAYNESVKAGIGVAKVLLPDALQKTVGRVLENGEYAPSNKSGSFSRVALAEWLSFASWADATVVAGDLGRNSETTIVLESFLDKSPKPAVLTKDTIDYLNHQSLKLLGRKDTTLVLTIAQLQKLCTNAGFATPIRFSMPLLQLVETLHELTAQYPANIVTNHHNVIFVASGGQVSTTPVEESETWRVRTAARAAVWLLQNRNMPFEALTSSLVRAS